MVKPPLKWAGGKRELFDEITERFPVSPSTYHEPFIGAGATYFLLGQVGGTINDLNARLINYYKQVRDNPEELIEKLRAFRRPLADKDPNLEFSGDRVVGRAPSNPEKKVYYYQQRDLFNRRIAGEPFDDLAEAARFQYLNRTCYNGLFRTNSDGQFNVPVDTGGTENWVFPDRIRGASEVLNFTLIYNRDYGYITEAALPGDTVYFDPPYKPVSASADFTNYTADGFDQDEQMTLIDVIMELDRMDVNVIVSNSGVMADPYMDAGLRVETVEVPRPINSDGTNRQEVDEVVATNIPRDTPTVGSLTPGFDSV